MRKLFFPVLYSTGHEGLQERWKENFVKRRDAFPGKHVFSPSLCYWEPGSRWLGEHHHLGLEVNGLTRRGTALQSALATRRKTSNFPRFIPALVTWAHRGGRWYPLRNKQYVCVCVCGTRTPTGGPRVSMWRGVTPHSRLGVLISLPQCAPLPGPGWQMVKDNVSTWESDTLRDWECVMGSATGYRDLLKNRNIICCWVPGHFKFHADKKQSHQCWTPIL